MDTPVESVVSTTRTAMTIGAVTAAAMLVVTAVGLQIFGLLVFVGGIYSGMKKFRKEAGGFIGYFEAFIVGIQTAFFASVILAFFTYVSATVEPAEIAAMLNDMEQQLISLNYPSGLTETLMQQLRETLSPLILAVAAIFSYNVIGGIIAAICAIFIRNEIR